LEDAKKMLRELYLNYTPSVSGMLYFRLGLNIIPESKYPLDVDGIKRICVMATAGIGNVIMLTPMIKTLRRGIRDGKITVVVATDSAKDVLEGSELVDQVILLNSKRSYKELRNDWLDLTIAATSRGFLRAKRAFRTGAMYRLGFLYDHEDISDTGLLYTHTVRLDETKHEVEQGLDLIRPLGLPEVRELYIHVTDEDKKTGEQILCDSGLKDGDLLIGVHAGMGDQDPKGRCWPMERFAQVCEILMENYGARPILLGDEKDVPVAHRIADIMKEKPLILAGKTTLRQTAAVLKKCRLFIGNDGGPMHIATAVGTTAVAIFGPTNAMRYGPYGMEHVVIKNDISCIPCHKPHEPGVECNKESECMKSVSVDVVMKAINIKLQETNSNNN
jgi:ADP-heptose:LPS heptosyltransferase